MNDFVARLEGLHVRAWLRLPQRSWLPKNPHEQPAGWVEASTEPGQATGTTPPLLPRAGPVGGSPSLSPTPEPGKKKDGVRSQVVIVHSKVDRVSRRFRARVSHTTGPLPQRGRPCSDTRTRAVNTTENWSLNSQCPARIENRACVRQTRNPQRTLALDFGA